MTEGLDLTIERAMENQGVSHAIREVVANALDERTLTDTDSIRVYKESDRWVIRDFGRGLQQKHLTDEREEKQIAENLIGKFGVGLKNALAILIRHNIDVKINSRHGSFSFSEAENPAPEERIKLRASINPSTDTDFAGTEFILTGCSDRDIECAKGMFLVFSDLELLERTQVGEIYRNDSRAPANIYINGLLTAQEQNFMFSYNITALNAPIKKALNQGRTAIGRTAYGPRVKEILRKCSNSAVNKILASSLADFGEGGMSDELKWSGVGIHAAKALNAANSVVFTTPERMSELSDDQKNTLAGSGKDCIPLPEDVLEQLVAERDLEGNEIVTVDKLLSEHNPTFEYVSVAIDELSAEEKSVFELAKWACGLCDRPDLEDKITLSETLPSALEGDAPLGERGESSGKIVMRRDLLQSKEGFLGALIQELVRATTGLNSETGDFQSALAETIGKLALEIADLRTKVATLETDFLDQLLRNSNSASDIDKEQAGVSKQAKGKSFWGWLAKKIRR